MGKRRVEVGDDSALKMWKQKTLRVELLDSFYEGIGRLECIFDHMNIVKEPPVIPGNVKHIIKLFKLP
jgi:hypothetical protein